MTPEELNTLAELVTEKLWDKFAVMGATGIFRANPSPAPVTTPDDYISTDQITHGIRVFQAMALQPAQTPSPMFPPC